MRVLAAPILLVLLAACAGHSALPAPDGAMTPGGALFSRLAIFAEPRKVTAAQVQRTFHATLVNRAADPLVFRVPDSPGMAHLDSIELSKDGGGIELALFPGADCVTLADAAAAFRGAGLPMVTDLAGQGGQVVTWRLPTLRGGQTYALALDFSDQRRCATQITIRYETGGASP